MVPPLTIALPAANVTPAPTTMSVFAIDRSGVADIARKGRNSRYEAKTGDVADLEFRHRAFRKSFRYR